MAKDGIETATAASAIPAIPEGKVLIVAQASELVGLPAYSNVTVGPFAAYRMVDDGTEDELKEHFRELSAVVEGAVQQQRDVVLNAVKAFAAGGGYKDVRN